MIRTPVCEKSSLALFVWHSLYGALCLVVFYFYSSVWHSLSSTFCLALSVWYSLSGTLCLIISVWQFLSGALCLAIYAWCSLSSTLCIVLSGTLFLVLLSGALCLALSVWHSLSDTLCLGLSVWRFPPGTHSLALFVWNSLSVTLRSDSMSLLTDCRAACIWVSHSERETMPHSFVEANKNRSITVLLLLKSPLFSLPQLLTSLMNNLT